MATIAIANDPRKSHRWPSPSTHETNTNTPITAAFQKEPVRYSSAANETRPAHTDNATRRSSSVKSIIPQPFVRISSTASIAAVSIICNRVLSYRCHLDPQSAAGAAFGVADARKRGDVKSIRVADPLRDARLPWFSLARKRAELGFCGRYEVPGPNRKRISLQT